MVDDWVNWAPSSSTQHWIGNAMTIHEPSVITVQERITELEREISTMKTIHEYEIGTLKEGIRKLLEEIEANGFMPSYLYATPYGDMKFCAYAMRWLDKVRCRVEQTTWEGYKIYTERHIIPYFKELNLSMRDVRPKHISDYYQYKCTCGRMDGREGGLSIESLKKHRLVLVEIFREAIIDEVVLTNPATGVRLPSKPPNLPRAKYLTRDEAISILEIVKDSPLEGPVTVTLYYALRRSEVLGLKWDAIDFENDAITIKRTIVKNLSIVEKDRMKNDTSYMTFALLPEVKRVLLKRREEQDEERRVFGKGYCDSGYVFTRADGTFIRPDTLTRSFERTLVRNGMCKIRYHDLRHTTASILYDSGWDMKEVQTWLRHSSIDVTSDTYTHITASRGKKLANRVDAVLAH